MIRRANKNDVTKLQQIGIKTFQDTFGNTCTKEDMQGVLALYFNTSQVLTELQDEEDNFFFYEENDLVKGYLRINAKHFCPITDFAQSRCIELVRLYVLNEYHGTGVANKLMEYALKFARNKGFDVIYLSVWEYNFRARGFYEKHSFTNTGIENDFPLGTTPQTDYWFVKKL